MAAPDVRFEFLEHTADQMIKAYGDTLEEQFSNAAVAVFSVFSHPELIRAKKSLAIRIKAADLKGLLYRFIEELLYYLDTNHFFLNDVTFMEITNSRSGAYTLSATLIGDTFREEYEVFGGVKAPTYNDMEFYESYVQFVVDI